MKTNFPPIKSIGFVKAALVSSLSFLRFKLAWWKVKIMIDIEKFVLQKAVEQNPLMRIHLIAMRLFGYILFDDQKRRRLHCFRGVVLSVSFVLFNVTQVSISM
jgi:hypothetical protein